MLFNARRVIKEKEKEIEEIKSQSNATSSHSIVGSGSQKNTDIVHSTKETSLNNSKKEIPARKLAGGSKDKRIMSKSAQKYRANANKSG